MLIFGGVLDAVGATNTALQFDLHKNCWSEVKWEGAIVPAARGGHSATVLNSKFLVVVGGTDGYTMVWDGLDLQDAWVLDLDTNSWQQLSPVGTLHAFGRQHIAVAASQESVVTFGGGFSRSNAAQKLTLRAGAAGGCMGVARACSGWGTTYNQTTTPSNSQQA